MIFQELKHEALQKERSNVARIFAKLGQSRMEES
jgi:hypothetical protein